MEKGKEVTYLSLLQDVESSINVITISNDNLRRKLESRIKKGRAFLQEPTRVKRYLASKKDKIINLIDKSIISLIQDIDVLREYFLERFSPNFIDSCRRLNKFDKPFIDGEFEAIGRCANHIIDSYEGRKLPIDILKKIVLTHLNKEYDKLDEKTITGYSKNKMRFTSSKEVLQYIRNLYEGDFVHKKYGKPSPEDVGKSLRKKSDSFNEELSNKGIKIPQTIRVVTTFLIACNQDMIWNNRRLDSIDNNYNNWRGRRTEKINNEETYIEDENEILNKFSEILYDKLFHIVNSGDRESTKKNRLKQISAIENGLAVGNKISTEVKNMLEADKQEVK